MREQLIRYVDLLFAGATDAEDMKQEILQNTLDRYDDLISQGKTPEAAYRLAISGIGDINEILGKTDGTQAAPFSGSDRSETTNHNAGSGWKKILRAAAVFLYIICPIPLFILSEAGFDTIGLCGTLGIVALATVLIMLSKTAPEARTARKQEAYSPRQELRNSVKNIIWTVGLCVYFLLSFATQAWYITWVIFPMIGAVQGLAVACLDLKEVGEYEN